MSDCAGFAVPSKLALLVTKGILCLQVDPDQDQATPMRPRQDSRGAVPRQWSAHGRKYSSRITRASSSPTSHTMDVEDYDPSWEAQEGEQGVELPPGEYD